MAINQTYIYSLSDPITKQVRYIGKANNIKVRFKAHIKHAFTGNAYCSKWIKSLLNNNLIPEVEIVDIVDKEQWQFWESFYIQLFKTWGFKLTNISPGGEGVNIKHTEQTKQKLRLANLGKKHSEETKLKISENHAMFWLGKKRSQEDKEKFRKSNLGKKSSEETKKKISDSISGENHHFYGKQLSTDHKNKISESWNSRPYSFNPEITKEKKSKAAKAQWARRKQNA